MRKDRQPESHGGSIYSRRSVRKGCRIFYVQKKWFNPALGQSVKYAETVPEPYRRATGARAATSALLSQLAAARAFKKDIDAGKIRNMATGEVEPWVPTKLKREREVTRAQEAKRERDGRAAFLFEKAWPRYLDDLEKSGNTYANQQEAKRAFERLERFWRGAYLDQITPGDVRRFYTERMNGTGPYSKKNWEHGGRRILSRTPEIEMVFMAALYKHLREDHPDLPLRSWPIRPTSGKKGSAFAPYKPAHRWPVPECERLTPLLRAIFSAERKAPNGHARIRDAHRAFWMLTFFTAARPESEPCRLRCGDVRFLDDGWALVSYRDTKNAHSEREIPVPPAVASALRDLMPPQPTPFEREALAKWRDTPVFRKSGKSRRSPDRAWNQSSYVKAWRATLEAVGGDFPEAADMWCRDLRPAARTALRRARVAPEVYRRFLGHAARDVDEMYDRVSAKDLREAAEALHDVVYGEVTEAIAEGTA